MSPTSPWRAFAHRNYLLFIIGHGISLCGTWMQSLAQAWLVYRLTGSPFLLGVVEFLARSPILVLGLVGGAIADRWPRKRILIAAHVLLGLQAVALAVLTLTDRVTIEWILGLAVFMGMVSVVEVPARQAFLTDLVPRSDIPSAIGLNSSMFNAARVIGPSLAGLLVATVGEGACFLINALSYLAIIGCILATRPPAALRTSAQATGRLLAEGLAYAWTTPHVRAVLSLATVLSVTALPFSTLLPVFAVDVLQGGPPTFGLLMGATGAGALAAALYLARRPSARGLERTIGRSVVGFALGLFGLAASPTLWLSVPALLLVGFGMVSSLASANTLLQSLAPDHLRGRVVSLYVTVSLGMTIFGSLLAGTGATYLGAPLTIAIGACVTLGAAAAYATTLPAIRRHIREHRLLAPEELPAS